MKTTKKFLSIILAILMIASSVPFAFAAESDGVKTTLDVSKGNIVIADSYVTLGGETVEVDPDGYIVTGTKKSDTPLKFINDSGSSITFDLVFLNLSLTANSWNSVIAIEDNSPVTLNIVCEGSNAISSDNHPVFNNTKAYSSITINITKTDSSSFTFERRRYPDSGILYDKGDTNTFVYINGNQLDAAAQCYVHKDIDGIQDCRGYLCDNCRQYFGETLDHIDKDGDGCCDYCGLDCRKTTLDVSKGNIVIADSYVTLGSEIVEVDPDGYIVTGTAKANTPLKFINDSGSSITFDLVFDNLSLTAADWCSVMAIEDNSPVTLNIECKGKNDITSHNHPVFNNTKAYSSITINITQTEGSSFTFERRSYPDSGILYDKGDTNTSVYINGNQLDAISLGEKIKVGDTYVVERKVYVKFVPTVSGTYNLSSSGDCNPYVKLYNGDMKDIAEADDNDGYNFSLTYNYEAGETYYFCFNDCNGKYNYSVSFVCDEHQGTTQTCKGYVCDACGEYFGEADENAHSFTDYEETEAPKCGVTGKEVATCDHGCGAADEKEIPALIHKDDNGDYLCDHGCGYEFEKPVDPTPDEPEQPEEDVCEYCGNDHSNPIYKIFCTITQFFLRLFRALGLWE